MEYQISWSEHHQSMGMGWNNQDGRQLFRGVISFLEDNTKHSLTFFYKDGQPNRPLVIGFPGYLADASGSGVFFDCVGQRFKDCTIVTLNDREGESRLGSWYLGKIMKDGCYSYLRLITALISHLQEKYQPSRSILYGTSMGGFGALLYSLLVRVDEVYLCVPQTNLNPRSHYFRRDPDSYDKERIPFTPSTKLIPLGLETYEKFTRKLNDHPYLDISNLRRHIGPDGRFHSKFFKGQFSSYYHLVSARYDHHLDRKGTYYRQMILPLITSLVEQDIPFSNTSFPFAMHDAFIYPQGILEYSEDALQNCISSSGTKRMRAENRIYEYPYWRPFMVAGAHNLWH